MSHSSDDDDDDDLNSHISNTSSSSNSSNDDNEQDHNQSDAPPPPSLAHFHPENGDQLILLRLPAEIPFDSLEKVIVSNVNQRLELHHPDYTIHNGHASEHTSMRMLVPSSSSRQLVLAPPFCQTCTVSTEPSTDIPSSQYPPLVLDRKAYGPVPQKAHLKRRWRPLGCPTSLALTPSAALAPKRLKLDPTMATNGQDTITNEMNALDTTTHDDNDRAEKHKSHKKKKKKKKHKKERKQA